MKVSAAGGDDSVIVTPGFTKGSPRRRRERCGHHPAESTPVRSSEGVRWRERQRRSARGRGGRRCSAATAVRTRSRGGVRQTTRCGATASRRALNSSPGPDELYGEGGNDTLIGRRGRRPAHRRSATSTRSTICPSGPRYRERSEAPRRGNSGGAAGDTISALSARALAGTDGRRRPHGQRRRRCAQWRKRGETTRSTALGGNDVAAPGQRGSISCRAVRAATRSPTASSVGGCILLSAARGQAASRPRTLALGGDTLEDVEDAEGGQGVDELIGSQGDNRLIGGAGPDTMSGGSGVGATAPDQFDGGRRLRLRQLWGARAAGVVVTANGLAGRRHPGNGVGGRRRRQRRQGHRAPQGWRRESTPLPPLKMANFPAPRGRNDVRVRCFHRDRSRLGLPAARATKRSPKAPKKPITSSATPESTTLNGLDGNDVLDPSGDAQADTASCGPGDADLAKLDLVDTQTGCETTQIAAVGRHPTVTIPRASPTLTRRGAQVRARVPARRGGRLHRDAGRRTGERGRSFGPFPFNLRAWRASQAAPASRAGGGPAPAQGAAVVLLTAHARAPRGAAEDRDGPASRTALPDAPRAANSVSCGSRRRSAAAAAQSPPAPDPSLKPSQANSDRVTPAPDQPETPSGAPGSSAGASA